MAMTTTMQLPEGGESHKRFDYKGLHRYYILVPTHKGEKIFTSTDTVRPVMDALRDVSLASMFEVFAYSFLPDRLILIVRGTSPESDMKSFLAAFRRASSAALAGEEGRTLWKKTYMERVLRKTEDIWHVTRDILRLPVSEGLARRAEDYPFQGSYVVPLSEIFGPPPGKPAQTRTGMKPGRRDVRGSRPGPSKRTPPRGKKF